MQIFQNLISEKPQIFFAFAFIVGALIGGLSSYFVKKPQNQDNVPEIFTVDETSPSERYIYADISGAVKRPGVYKMKEDDRVVDLLKEGGGVTSSKSYLYLSKNVNLAKKLSDQTKLYVPYSWELVAENNFTIKIEDPVNSISNSTSSGTSVGESNSNDTQKKDINTMTMDELDALPGVGSVYASKIITGRPYKDYEELVEKSGVPQSTLDKFKSYVVFE